MKKIKLIFILAMIFHSSLTLAINYENKKVKIIRSPDSRPCILFQLEGVADAGESGNPWFALHPDKNNGYQEIVSMILASKLSDRPITVASDGQVYTDCGHARVTVIHI